MILHGDFSSRRSFQLDLIADGCAPPTDRRFKHNWQAKLSNEYAHDRSPMEYMTRPWSYTSRPDDRMDYDSLGEGV